MVQKQNIFMITSDNGIAVSPVNAPASIISYFQENSYPLYLNLNP